MPPDPKPARRIKDPSVFRRLHLRGVICVLCGKRGSLHHVYPKGQGGDDVEANLVGLCGDGVRGCHGMIEAQDEFVRIALGAYIKAHRQDIITYVQGKLGKEAGSEWLLLRLFIANA